MTVKSKQQTSFQKDYISGLKLLLASVSSIQIESGRCRDTDDTFDMIITSTLTATITSSGANGLDTGSEAASTFYYVWLIFNPSTKTYASLFSTSSTSPTMPSGYTKKRRVGVVRNDSSSDLLNFRQFGKGNNRKYLYQEDQATTLRVLTGGTATAYTAVSVAAFVPSLAEFIILYVDVELSSDDGWIRPGIPTTDYYFITGNGTYIEMFYNDTGGADLAYKVTTGGDMDIAVLGFYEEL